MQIAKGDALPCGTLSKERRLLLLWPTDRVVCPVREAVEDISSDFMFETDCLLRIEPANVGSCGCEQRDFRIRPSRIQEAHP